MPFDPPTLSLDSPLFAAALSEDFWHVTQYMGHGGFPAHRAEKEAAERYVAHVIAALDRGDAPRLADELRHYLTAMFPPDELARGVEDPALVARQIGYAALQRAVDAARSEMEERSFAQPSPADPVLSRCGALEGRLTKDGLVRLEPQDVADEVLRSQGVIAIDDVALYPHPMLASARELVIELLELAAGADLDVAIAVHPFRTTTLDEVPLRLLQDYWYGIKLTPESLDSLDRHDTGVRTFHAAQADPAKRFFFPLLGTWFDWERRSRHDVTDPIKRLYVQEVRPAADRLGEAHVAALNRELHAERDTAARCFTHVDGKICLYDASEYAPTSDYPDAPLGTPRLARKLWRVDGEIPNEVWEQLVGLYFRQNELIAEHLGSVLSEHTP